MSGILKMTKENKRDIWDEKLTRPGDLRRRTINGLSWRFGAVWIKLISQFGISVVLARMLPPEDFGLVALAMIVIGLGELVTDLGLGPSLIQRQELTKNHVRIAFTISAANGGLLALLVIAAAPFFAQLLRDPRIASLIQLLSIKFIVTGFGIVSYALLTRRLRFRNLLVVDLGSYVLGYGGVGIFLALQGKGVISLVYGSILQSALQAVFSYVYVRHSLLPLIRLSEIKDMASFSIGVSLERIVNYFALQGDFFVVGRILGSELLGYYSRAYTLMRFPLSYFVKVLSHVMFPVASQIQSEGDRLKRAYIMSLSLTSFVIMPILTMIVILAPEIMLGIFGGQWKEAIAPLRILGVFGVFRATYHLAASFIKANGQIYRLFSYQIVYGIAVIGGSWIAAPRFGINGVAFSVGFAILVMFALVVSCSNRLLGISAYQFLSSQWPGVTLSLIATPFALLFQFIFRSLGLSNIGVLVLCIIANLFILSLAVWLMPSDVFGNLPVIIFRLSASVAPPRIQGAIRSLAKRVIRRPVQNKNDNSKS